MNLVDVAAQVAAAADTIDGLRIIRPGDAVRAPALVIGYPDSITFDETYGRGVDRLTLPVFLMVSRTSERAGGLALLAYLSGAGAQSVKAAIEAGTYTACDTVHVATASVAAFTSEGVEYLGAELMINIVGSGG